MKKKTIIIIISFILCIALTATITTIIVKSNQKELPKETEKIDNNTNNEIKNELENKEENNNQEESKNETSKENIKPTEDIKKPSNNVENNKEESNQTLPKTENDVINYINEVSESNNENKLKTGFVKLVDFIFYDGEIYGKTFKELSNKAKIKIISLALKIDTKIEEYYPGYKEKISETTSKTYNNIKNKLVTLYMDTTVKICSNNETLCEDAKAGLQDLKENFGITWEFIKDITGTSLTKLKDWYEIWREK